MTNQFDVAIVGGGASGTVLAIELARGEGQGPSVLLTDPHGAGRGTAYGTPSPHHLLNVRAHAMSAFASEPAGFAEWLGRAGHDYLPDDFVPREIYGRYLSEHLETARTRSTRLTLAAEEIVRLDRTDAGFELGTAGGERFAARSVVLALGNFPPGQPWKVALPETEERYLPNPWPKRGVPSLTEIRSIVILGSALTAVDWVYDAIKRGYSGSFTLVSRHGFMPESHSREHFTPKETKLPEGFGLRDSLTAVLDALRDNVEWRAVIDGLRPVTQKIWMAWSEAERGAFMRHLRPRWEVARHRVAPEIGDILAGLERDGRLTRVAGRVMEIRANTGGIEVAIRTRAGERRELTGDLVVNCTGPDPDPRKWSSKLVAHGIESGLLSVGPLGLGLGCMPDGEMLDGKGAVVPGLFGIGPVRRGVLWETTAMREIRQQAADLADRLCSVLG